MWPPSFFFTGEAWGTAFGLGAYGPIYGPSAQRPALRPYGLSTALRPAAYLRVEACGLHPDMRDTCFCTVRCSRSSGPERGSILFYLSAHADGETRGLDRIGG